MNVNNTIPSIITNGGGVICLGESETLSATGGISYTWSPSTGLNTTISSTVIASPSITTTYTVLVEGANGCISSETITVTVNKPCGLD